MPVNLTPPQPGQLLPVRGVALGVAEANIKKPGRKDLLVIALGGKAHVAGVFTQNRFCAAPVTIAREHLHSGRPVCALVVNTGNANAGTGEEGLACARRTCSELAALLDCESGQVLPFSTGVIMEPLPVERVVAGLPAAKTALDADGWAQAAEGIMTTDTVPKAVSRQVTIDGRRVTVTGIAKGAGMIRPDMATMLGFVATDAAVAPAALDALVRDAAGASFNRITDRKS